MIQINLVPDVKQELLKAQRTRSVVISFAILAMLVSVGVVIAVGLYVFVGQGIRNSLADGIIKDEYKKLTSVQDLNKMVTIQSQMVALKDISAIRQNNSRIFDIENAIKPKNISDISIKTFSLNPSNKVMTLQASAQNYSELGVFKKTIEATKFSYTESGEVKTQEIASNVSVLTAALGDDNSGGRVLNFTISFNYDEALLSNSVQDFKLIPPASPQDVTDSKLAVPSGALSTSEGGN